LLQWESFSWQVQVPEIHFLFFSLFKFKKS
jgi:hypothetical protein